MKKTIFLIFAIISAIAVHSQNQNLTKVIEAFSAKQYHKVISFINNDLKDNPQSAISFYYRAYSNFYLSKNAASISDVNNALKFATVKETILKANLYELRAKNHVAMDNQEKAIVDYSTAIKLNPSNSNFFADRGQIYFDMKQNDKAKNDYKQVLKIDENDERGRVGLGCCYSQEKKYAEAEMILSELTKKSPTYAPGFYFKARVMYDLKKYSEAIKSIFEALRLEQTKKLAQSYFLKYAVQNYPLALSLLTAQINADPTIAFWYNMRSQVYKQQGNSSAAIIDYRKVVELSDVSEFSNLFINRD